MKKGVLLVLGAACLAPSYAMAAFSIGPTYQTLDVSQNVEFGVLNSTEFSESVSRDYDYTLGLIGVESVLSNGDVSFKAGFLADTDTTDVEINNIADYRVDGVKYNEFYISSAYHPNNYSAYSLKLAYDTAEFDYFSSGNNNRDGFDSLSLKAVYSGRITEGRFGFNFDVGGLLASTKHNGTYYGVTNQRLDLEVDSMSTGLFVELGIAAKVHKHIVVDLGYVFDYTYSAGDENISADGYVVSLDNMRKQRHSVQAGIKFLF